MLQMNFCIELYISIVQLIKACSYSVKSCEKMEMTTEWSLPYNCKIEIINLILHWLLFIQHFWNC